MTQPTLETTTETVPGDILSTYERQLAPARDRLLRGRWATRLAARDFRRDELEAFLLWFTSQGIAMTRHVEDWIRRAGQRCIELGHVQLGQALRAHAHHEAGHDALFRDDAIALAARWNADGRLIDVEKLLAWAPTAGVRAYARLHEEIIGGASPYCQIAVEYEIERLSVVIGPSFIATTIALCGPDIRSCLSFVEEHVLLDQGHTHFNERQLRQFLVSHPDALPALVAAGSAALDAYAAYLEDCLDLALTAEV